MVFYAGHGIEVGGRNFLVPVDAQLKSDREVEFETVPLDLVSRAVEAASGLGLVILDACRDNPFAAAMQRAGSSRSIGRGLARVEPSGEMLVAYAAKGGTVASDGKGRNSPYSTALLRYLEEPGLEVGLMFRKVRDAVLKSTGRKQEPFVYGSLSSKGFYLARRPAAPATPQAKPAIPPKSGSGSDRLTAEQLAAKRLGQEKELLFWQSVKDSRDPADIRAYLQRYPKGTYAALADNMLKRLEAAAAQPGSGAAAGPENQSAALPSKPGPAKPETPADPAAAEATLGLSFRDRSLIQWGLSAAGFDPGPADGAFGPRTRAALKAWQARGGAAATGHLTLAAANALKAAGEKAYRAAGRPGRTFRDCAACPVMAVLPAGSFVMGSPSHEQGRSKAEGPQRRVSIRRPFAVGKYEVTVAEWDACVSAGGCSDSLSVSGWDNNQRPIAYVGWNDAKQYVRWLSRRTGKRYRLLSESEWEYAARAGTRTSRYWGNSVSAQCGYANGADGVFKEGNSDWRWQVAPCRDGHVDTAPVGSLGANGFGLHDLLGNVSEWVEDCWHDSYQGAPSDGRAWTSGGDCGRRVMRGGSYFSSPNGLRAAARSQDSGGENDSDNGFRVARTLAP